MKKNLLFLRLIFFGLFMLFSSGWVVGQTTRYWKGSGTWTSANQWAITSGGTYNTTWVSNDIAVFDVASSTVTFASTGVTGITANENVTFTAAGTLTTNGTQIPIFVASGKTLSLSGQSISTAVGTGIIKNGPGVMISSNGNLYPGGFTLNEGTMAVGGVNAMGSGGTLIINGGSITSSTSTSRTLTGKYAGGIIINENFSFGDANNVSSGTGNLTFDNNVTLGNSVSRTITLANTGTYTLGGIISGTSSNLTVAETAAGTLSLTGANTYSGLTTVTGGTLKLAKNGGTTLPITNNITISGGTLQISSNQTFNNLDLGSGGTLLIDNGITVTINGTLTHRGGTITLSGTGTVVYGASGTIEYAGSATQTASAIEWPTSSGPATVTINNSNNFRLPFSRTLSGNFIVTSGDVRNESGSAVTLTLSGSDANLQVNGSITGTNVGSGNDLNLLVSGTKTTVSGSGTLVRFLNITVNSGSTLALSRGLQAMWGTWTQNGTLQIDGGGYVDNAGSIYPTYGSSSTLIYNIGGTYGRSDEWTATSGAGYPANVQLSNSTTLDLGANSGTGTARQMSGNLTIDLGSTLQMASSNPMTAALTVLGNVANSGTLILSTSIGGDLKVGGNWSNSGTFTPNNRAVFFNGTAAQSIGASTFDWLLIDKASGTASISGNVIINNTLTVSNGTLSLPAAYYISTASLTNGGTVNVLSDASNSGSLIISGTYSGAGTFTYQRYMTGNKWHMTGSPQTGQAINSSFLTSNNVLSDGAGGYFMKYFNENSNSWSTNFTDATSDAFELAQAFAVKRNGDGIVNLSGTPNNAEVNATLVRSANGWNLLANPFTSAIAANTIAGGQNSLLKDANLSNLEPSYATLYVWEEGVDYPTSTNYYKVITNEGGTLGQDYVQVGQGFFVKSKSGGGTFNIAPNMQSHQTATAFKSEPIAWTRINLNAEISNAKASTRISYNENMTKGLDISYDAGLLNSYPQFALYSKLIEDNGSKFMVQCLPTDFENLVVPIGLDAQAGEIVKFSARSENLPDNYKVVLEDRTLGVFTNLSEDNAEYSIQLINESRGTGRFFVRTSMESALGIGDLDNESPYKVFTRPNHNQIVIRGIVNANTIARIYTISGKQIADIHLKQSNESLVQFNEEAGVYIVKISNEKGTTTQKFVWVK